MIGILPAGGRATRIYGIPKFLLPVDGTFLLDFHVQAMHDAGAMPILICAQQQTAPFLAPYLQPSERLVIGDTTTMSGDVLAVRTDEPVLFGMPDTYWDAPDVYPRLAAMLSHDIDVAIACWQIRPDQVGYLGQLYFNGLHRVQAVVDKDPTCCYPWAWGALAWNAKFWDCIDPATPHVGYAVAEAVRRGLHVFALPVEGSYWDCGTFDHYAQLCARHVEERING